MTDQALVLDTRSKKCTHRPVTQPQLISSSRLRGRQTYTVTFTAHDLSRRVLDGVGGGAHGAVCITMMSMFRRFRSKTHFISPALCGGIQGVLASMRQHGLAVRRTIYRGCTPPAAFPTKRVFTKGVNLTHCIVHLGAVLISKHTRTWAGSLGRHSHSGECWSRPLSVREGVSVRI